MKTRDLTKYGLTDTKAHWNLEPEELQRITIEKGMGKETANGTLAINTGKYTGRSPQDRFIVKDDYTDKRVWWGKTNKAISPENFDYLQSEIENYLSGKEIYVRDAYVCADPDRKLIGDDEHGWTANNNIFNFEGGCYAKAIDLTEEKEPDIYRAIKPGAILENVVFKDNGEVDYMDGSITQNTRVSYPIYHIDNIQEPSFAGNPTNIFFLTCDAFGVLPPVSKLTPGQAAYHFISGYTAKVAGTEAGITEPVPSFSACFGEPFMPLHPTVYAEMLSKKMQEAGVNVWLINTGWSGGPYGVGSRIKLKYTRAMITAILNGELDDVEFENHPIFGLAMPKTCPNVPEELLDPINTWLQKGAYISKSIQLAHSFHLNFEKFASEASDEIMNGGPLIDEHHHLNEHV